MNVRDFSAQVSAQASGQASGNGQDPILTLLLDLQARMENLAEAVDDLAEKVSDINLGGEGFGIEN